MRVLSWTVLTMIIPATLSAGEGTQVVGWRGDGTGRFPSADPPSTWERRCTSPVATLTFRARKPKSGFNDENRPLIGGFIPEWLVLGPVPAEPAARPPADTADEGEKHDGLAWKLHHQETIEEITRKDRWSPWNPGNDVDFINLGKILGVGENQAAWALTRVFADRGGAVSILVNHSGSLTAWVNGRQTYAASAGFINLSFFSGENRPMNCEFGYPTPSPRFDVSLRQGWNSILFKATSGKQGCKFNLRVTAPADTKYETKNIRWVTPMPAWSNGTPIVVRDRIYLTSEPDELVCISAKDGKILWRRSNTFYDAIPTDERSWNPLYAQIEPLARQLPTAVGEDQIWNLRVQIHALMRKIDPKRFVLSGDHTPAHGFATPTPVSDGVHVYVYFGHGVAACYDLDGHRKWIRLVNDIGSSGLFNCNAPVLVDGKFIFVRARIRALDARTGAIAWTTPELTEDHDMEHGGGLANNWAQALNVARVNEVAVVYLPGKMVRVADGKVLMTQKSPGHWTTPVIVNNTVYDMPDGTLVRLRIQSTSPDKAALVDEAKFEGCGDLTFSSPLLHEGIVYGIDCKGVMAAFEAGETGPLRKLYSKDLDMKPWFHANANGVAASVALGGKYLYFFDDQGTCVILEPGRVFKLVARNRIEDFMQRRYCINTWEVSTRSSPVFDGDCLYVRGEHNLYCISAQK
jgi:outer membrane protein assembly factor BamB